MANIGDILHVYGLYGMVAGGSQEGDQKMKQTVVLTRSDKAGTQYAGVARYVRDEHGGVNIWCTDRWTDDISRATRITLFGEQRATPPSGIGVHTIRTSRGTKRPKKASGPLKAPMCVVVLYDKPPEDGGRVINYLGGGGSILTENKHEAALLTPEKARAVRDSLPQKLRVLSEVRPA